MEGTKLLKYVREANLLKRVFMQKSTPIATKIIGEIIIEQKLVRLGIVFSSNFPHELPVVQFLNYMDYPLISHVFSMGVVCFADVDSVIIRTDEPIAVVHDVIQLAIDTITKGFNGITTDDLLNDFELYWKEKATVGMDAIISPSIKPKYIYQIENCFGDSKVALTDFFQKQDTSVNIENLRCTEHILIPITNTKLLRPRFWTSNTNIYEFLFAILHNLLPDELRNLLIMLNHSINSTVVFQLSLPNDYYCFVGLQLTPFIGSKEHPLINKLYSKSTSIFIKRKDKAFLLERAGGNLKLQNKRVILVGCGSVGSYIAQEIAKTGIQELVLIDYDVFEANNLYRHTLGLHKNLQKSKVDALKEKLTKEVPFIKIQTFNSRIETIIDDENKHQNLNFGAYDLVIVATGNPNTNFELNKYFLQDHEGLPVLYTWLDPYGIGGHTLVSNNKNEGGCYRCLYNEQLHNETSFVAPNQKFTKSLSGCSGYFVPFSALDANQVALQTIRVAIRVLLEEEQDNPIVSWKGDATSFLGKGFQLSSRYQQSTEKLLQEKYGYKKEHCTVCGK
jgi:molybdopterin/thiamine biosynthesis adenylyltransferase